MKKINLVMLTLIALFIFGGCSENTTSSSVIEDYEVVGTPEITKNQKVAFKDAYYDFQTKKIVFLNKETRPTRSAKSIKEDQELTYELSWIAHSYTIYILDKNGKYYEQFEQLPLGELTIVVEFWSDKINSTTPLLKGNTIFVMTKDLKHVSVNIKINPNLEVYITIDHEDGIDNLNYSISKSGKIQFYAIFGEIYSVNDKFYVFSKTQLLEFLRNDVIMLKNDTASLNGVGFTYNLEYYINEPQSFDFNLTLENDVTFHLSEDFIVDYYRLNVEISKDGKTVVILRGTYENAFIGFYKDIRVETCDIISQLLGLCDTLTSIAILDREVVLGNGAETVLYKGQLNTTGTLNKMTLNPSEFNDNIISTVISSVTLNINGYTFRGDIQNNEIVFMLNHYIDSSADVLITTVLKENEYVQNYSVLSTIISSLEIVDENGENINISIDSNNVAKTILLPEQVIVLGVVTEQLSYDDNSAVLSIIIDDRYMPAESSIYITNIQYYGCNIQNVRNDDGDDIISFPEEVINDDNIYLNVQIEENCSLNAIIEYKVEFGNNSDSYQLFKDQKGSFEVNLGEYKEYKN
ncbi:MAG: hypothetical protein Q9M94_07815 [Candidatus Gracilibacteria bacterium]|nr:hypothetical protein [Candidatus Gracilibacteria bacterium]